MENEAATLYCPNELCQAPNPLTHKFCQRCSSALPKVYLWVMGGELKVGSPGEILADRYLIISNSVVFDTKPGLEPQSPELETLQELRPYLRLFPYRLHVPQVYGVLTLTNGSSPKEILLLEKAPIYINGTPNQVQPYSELTSAWGNATAMRQLHWLWQIANIWQPLASEGVASSLLAQGLLRVEGPLVRLLELKSDGETPPSLSQLGEFWQGSLLPNIKPGIAEFSSQICQDLIQGKIRSPEQLVNILDKGLSEVGRSLQIKVTIATKTDTGPRRQRNEDSCYPPSGSNITKPPQTSALAIVCDGIGGHEGGNVASNLAIETMQQQLQDVATLPSDHIDALTVLTDLERAAAKANDKISEQNDNEHRQGRQRMGTTLVMGLPIGHEIYIAHVGDSRAYWITRQGCYQVTLDDDVASREVRLGYAVYREVVNQPGSGSLVQALGMSPSNSLHPTAQRFILDEDSVFLLCSDGLSDFDRVEQHWETEILPILSGKLSVSEATNRLVEIANTQNGHDNVTIALLHCQVPSSQPKISVSPSLAEFDSQVTGDSQPAIPTVLPEERANQKTQVIADTVLSKRSKLPVQLLILFPLIVMGGILGYLAAVEMRLKPPFTITTSPTATTPPAPTTPTASTNPPVATTTVAAPPRTLDNLAQGWVIETKQQINFGNKSKPNSFSLPDGSFLEVVETKPNSNPDSGGSDVELRVCSVGGQPNSATVDKRVSMQKSQLQRFKVSVLPADTESACTPPSQPAIKNEASPISPENDVPAGLEDNTKPTSPQESP
ncbi:MAG: protein phosphatase 2C domain-containing protein [Nostocaceae cyanobacterium]|nr:protein phosphatase 2C domain-containing protein [Nostocaceae cyanobacterium]